MKKIPTLFRRDGKFVVDEVTPGCEWVIAGEGVPRRKFDGTCTMFDGLAWWARREVKPGKKAPDDFVEADYDENTDKRFGWVPIETSGYLKYFEEALENSAPPEPLRQPVGTYELVGPKVNGNPEGLDSHELVRHKAAQVLVLVPPLDFEFLSKVVPALRHVNGFEGVVWHHPDGRMAKLKGRDFRC